MSEIPFDPLADHFPLMSEKDFADLTKDIEANGLLEPITTFQGMIFEGRHRDAACAMAGVEPRYEEFTGDEKAALAFVISKNLHRRHLTPERKRELIGELIKAQPDKSNRAIAEQAKVDKNTVTAVRQEMEGRGEFADRTRGSGGEHMNVTVEKPRPANHTARRLRALEPGEAFVFYRGDLAADISSSKGAPAYACVLAEVEAAARELQAAGRIVVTDHEVVVTRDGQRFVVNEYRALGLAASQVSDDEDSGSMSDEAAAA
jgi:ParB-like chromosome segregation protein Spo0J